MQFTSNPPSFQHDVFICYNAQDREFVLKLKKALKRHRAPKESRLSSEHLNIFLDEPELIQLGYDALLQKQLLNSKKLIVICSPHSRNHSLQNHRIYHFLQRNASDNIIPILFTSAHNNYPQDSRYIQESFPKPLKELNAQHRAIKFINFDLDRDSLEKNTFANSWYELLSSIENLPSRAIAVYEAGRQRTHQKQKRLKTIGALLAVLILLLSIAGLMFKNRLKHTEKRLMTARQDQVNRYWRKAEHALKEQHYLPALHLMTEAASITRDKQQRTDLLQEMERYQPLYRLAYIKQLRGKILGASFNREEDKILLWSDDHRVRLWDTVSGKNIFPPLLHSAEVNGAMFNSDESHILTWSQDHTVSIWDARTGKQLAPSPLRHPAAIIGVTLNDSETHLLSWNDAYSAHLWELKTGRQIGRQVQHSGWINGVLFNHNNSDFLSWSDDSTAQFWLARTGERMGPALRHHGEINGAALNRAKTELFTWGNDSTIRRWDVRTLQIIDSTMRHQGDVTGACLDQAERRLLTWGRDNTARLWDLRTGRQIGRSMQHQRWVFGARFNYNNTRILTWSYDNTARLWNAETGLPMTDYMRHTSGKHRNNSAVFNAWFNFDESRIITWGDDNTVRVWDSHTGKQIALELLHYTGTENHDIKGVIFDKLHSYIFTWSTDSTARLWQARSSAASKSQHRQIDLDFPPDKLQLQLMALTGTEFDTATNTIHCLAPKRWQELNERYLKFAIQHYQETQYPQGNIWRHFFPKQAQKLRH